MVPAGFKATDLLHFAYDPDQNLSFLGWEEDNGMVLLSMFFRRKADLRINVISFEEF